MVNWLYSENEIYSWHVGTYANKIHTAKTTISASVHHNLPTRHTTKPPHYQGTTIPMHNTTNSPHYQRTKLPTDNTNNAPHYQCTMLSTHRTTIGNTMPHQHNIPED